MNNGQNKKSRKKIPRIGDIIPPFEEGSPTSKASVEQNTHSGIPKFDLTEQIMAEQRKIIATKRTAPGKRDNSADNGKSKPAIPIVERNKYAEPKKYSVIADIVARDIERLCAGGK